MRLISWLESRRYRRVWADPHRSLLTLESFAETEADGGRDLSAALKRARDPEVIGHLERHAGDELRHARLFRERAASVAAGQGRHIGAKDEELGRAYDLSGARQDEGTNAHGFFPPGLFEELGEVPYIAMLHVAEQRAATLFERHARAARAMGDGATAEVFEAILRDEKYHVAWTGKVLERWRGEGRDVEVRRGLAEARRGRALGAWRSLGLRSASGLSRVVLALLYWTLLAPFGLVASRGRNAAPGWSEPRLSTPSSQY